MTIREGSLEAPTRHPIDWQEPDFYDEAKRSAGDWSACSTSATAAGAASACAARFRRCSTWSTKARPARSTAWTKADYAKVVDQCYLCDLCYMTKCPYVPPHPWNVDFPHLMLRAKAVKFKRGETTFRDRLLTGTDRLGKLATIPVVVQIVNAVNSHAARAQADGQDARRASGSRGCPNMRARRFASRAADGSAGRCATASARRARSRSSRPATSTTTSPASAHDLLKILRHNEIPYRDRREGSVLRHAEARTRRPRSGREAERTSTFRTWRSWRARATRS